MKAKLRASTTIPALLAVAAAITGATAFLAPAPARAADEVALPLPSIRWDPVESGTSVPNTGSRDGLPDATSAYALLLKKFTGANFNATPGVDLVSDEGTGPFQNGRAIDLSSNPLMGNTPNTAEQGMVMIGATSGMNFAGFDQFTFCLWYKIDSPFNGTNGATIIRNENGIQLQFLAAGNLRLDVYSDSAQTTGLGNLSTTQNAALTQQGKWVFLAVTWDGATGNAAIHFGTEGMETAELRAGTLLATGKLGRGSTNLGLNLGYNNTSNSPGTFDGWFADVRLYNTALSIEQLEKIRTGAATGYVSSYLPTVKNFIDNELVKNWTDEKIDAAAAPLTNNPNDRLSEMAGCAARLWLLGGKTEPAYAYKAFYFLKALLDQRARSVAGRLNWRVSFQAKFAFLEAYKILLENDYAVLDPAFDEDFIAAMKAAAANNLTNNYVGDHNGGACDGAGAVQALALWPELDTLAGGGTADGALTDYIRRQWNSWAAFHDTLENALNYNKLFLPMTILMAQRAAGVPGLDSAAMFADLDHPGARAIFTRARDQISPSGQQPSYGDSGNATPLPELDCWPSVFEWAAKRWNDPASRWAAQSVWKVLRASTTRQPLNLFLLTYADEWADLEMEPAQPQTGSALQTRNTKTSPQEPDKIILAPSRDSGAPFLLAEAFAHGSHSHTEQIGAISHYEYNHNLYLWGLGYNNRASDKASMFLVNRPSDGFPWRAAPQRDTWYEAAIPTILVPEITDPADPRYGAGGRHIIDRPTFRFEQRSTTDYAYGTLSDFRLVARDGAETLLNAFNDISGGWNGSTTLAAGPTGAANSALRFRINPQTTGNGATFVVPPESQRSNLGVLPAEHPFVKFWWKVESAAEIDDQIIIYRESYPGEQDGSAIAWLQPFAPETTAANVETAAGARYGSLTVDDYFTLGTRLTRRIVQLDNGAVVVHDTLLPGADADGRLAGPVWQLVTAADPAPVATGVYDATGFYNTKTRAAGADRLLVVMERAPGRQFGAARPPVPLWNSPNTCAAYARSTLRAGVPASFVTVLLPNDGATAAATLAAAVRIRRDAAGGAIIQLDAPAAAGGATTQVTLGPGDAWSVDAIAAPAPATVTLGGLLQAYDGAPKPVTVTTVPAGLPVVVTYGEERSPAPPSEIGSYPVVAQIDAPGYHGEATGTLLIREPSAYIMEQPLPRVAAVGETVTLSVLASGRQPVACQWEKSADGLTGWVPVGGDSDTLVLAGLTAADAGFYRVTATNDIGAGPVSDTSAAVELAVVPAPFPAPRPDGAASAATGGGAAPALLVSTEAALRAYAALDTPAVLTLRGHVTLAGGDLVLGSDKTLQGIDSAATLAGGLRIGPGAQNVIVRGLNLSNPAPGAPALAVTAATGVYLDHLTLFAGGGGGPLATIDAASDAVTLAWSELYFTGDEGARSALLAGAAGPAAPLRLTLHHNLWRDAAQDMPLAVNADVHLYNNHFSATGNLSTIVLGDDAQALVDSNLFDGVNAPLLKTGSNALARTRRNLHRGGAPAADAADPVFAPAHPSLVQSPAGGFDALLAAAAGNTAGAASATPPAPVTLAITGAEGALPDSVSFTLSSTLAGAAARSWQWHRDHAPIEGATGPALTVDYARQALSGAYVLEALLENGDTAVSNPRHITIGAPVPPAITLGPLPLGETGVITRWTANEGDSVSFFVEAGGDPVLRYQWQRQAAAFVTGTVYDDLPGATFPTLNLGRVTANDGGAYRVKVLNHSGTATSPSLTLNIYNPAAGSRIGDARDGDGGGAPTPWLPASLAALLLAAGLRRAA